ncbi:DUF386 family protein [Streptococcus suis]|nr:DUF386 family protein [Streptococcus suis]
MIYDRIDQALHYKGLDPNLDTALERLVEGGFDQLVAGRHDCQGDQVFFFLQDNQLALESSPIFEYHKRYADLHVILEGSEKISYSSEEALDPTFKEEGDIGFTSVEDRVDFILNGHHFLLCFPQELHQPNQFMGQDQEVKKLVFKILMK